MSALIRFGTQPRIASLENAAMGDALSRAPRVSGFAAGSVVAHRGGALTANENSLSAFRGELAAGSRMLETDVLLTSDGVPVLMHDTNTSRTTGINKAVSAYTSAEWNTTQLNPALTLGESTSYLPEKLPTLAEFFDLCKNRAVMTVEAKADAAVPVIIQYAQAAGVARSALVIMSFNLPALAPVPASGYEALWLVSNLDAVNMTTVKAAGVRYIGYGNDTAASGAKIAEARALGIDCFRWTINRRSTWATAQNNGAAAAITDDPEYLRAGRQICSKDEFASRRWMPGMFPSYGSSRGVFFDDGSWGHTEAGDVQSYLGSLMGWACPLPAAHSIVVDLRFDSVANNSRWGGIFTGSDNDHVYTDSVSDLAEGYHCLCRQGGLLQIYKKITGSGPVLLQGFQSTTPFPVGTGAYTTVRVDVTPSAVTLTRLDTGELVSTTDTQFRGGYFHLGRNGAAVRWRNLSVTKVN